MKEFEGNNLGPGQKTSEGKKPLIDMKKIIAKGEELSQPGVKVGNTSALWGELSEAEKTRFNKTYLGEESTVKEELKPEKKSGYVFSEDDHQEYEEAIEAVLDDAIPLPPTDFDNDGKADEEADVLVKPEQRKQKLNNLDLYSIKRLANEAEDPLAFFQENQDFLEKDVERFLRRLRRQRLQLPPNLLEKYTKIDFLNADLSAYKNFILNLEKGLAFINVISQFAKKYEVYDHSFLMALFVLFDEASTAFTRLGTEEKDELKRLALGFKVKYILEQKQLVNLSEAMGAYLDNDKKPETVSKGDSDLAADDDDDDGELEIDYSDIEKPEETKKPEALEIPEEIKIIKTETADEIAFKEGKVSNAENFEDLYKVIEEIAPVVGSRDYVYSADELNDKIRRAIDLKDRSNLDFVTNKYGIRNVVIDLFREEILSEINDIKILGNAAFNFVEARDRGDLLDAILQIEKGDFTGKFIDKYGILARAKELKAAELFQEKVEEPSAEPKEEKPEEKPEEKKPESEIIVDLPGLKVPVVPKEEEKPEVPEIINDEEETIVEPEIITGTGDKVLAAAEIIKPATSETSTQAEVITAENLLDNSLSEVDLLTKVEAERRVEMENNYEVFLNLYRNKLIEEKEVRLQMEDRVAAIKAEETDIPRLDTDPAYLKAYGNLCRELTELCVKLEKSDREIERMELLTQKYVLRFDTIKANSRLTLPIQKTEEDWLNEISEGIGQKNNISLLIANKVHQVQVESSSDGLRVSFDPKDSDTLLQTTGEQWEQIDDIKNIPASDNKKIEKWMDYGFLLERADYLTKLRKFQLFSSLSRERQALAFSIEKKYGAILPMVKSDIPVYFKLGQARIANGFLEMIEERSGKYPEIFEGEERRAYHEAALYEIVLQDKTINRAQLEKIKNRLNALLIKYKDIKKLLVLENFKYLKILHNGLLAVEKRDVIRGELLKDDNEPPMAVDDSMLLEEIPLIDAAGKQHIVHKADLGDISKEQKKLAAQWEKKEEFINNYLIYNLKVLAKKNKWPKENVEDWQWFIKNPVADLLANEDLSYFTKMIEFLKNYPDKLSKENQLYDSYIYLRDNLLFL